MLGWLRAALAFSLLAASVFIGAVFATQNTSVVPLSLFVITLPEQTMAVWLLLFLIAGLATGSLISSAIVLRQRAGLAALRRENTRLKQRMEHAPSNGLAEYTASCLAVSCSGGWLGAWSRRFRA